MTTHAWLAEECPAGPKEIIGIFSDPDKAQDACQASAGEYFGPENTKPLHWNGYDGRIMASHYDPGSGNVIFVITRFTVDEALK